MNFTYLLKQLNYAKKLNAILATATTAVLVLLTFALVWLGIRAENHLNRLNNVLLRLLRVQYVHAGTVAGRTIEVKL
jgi:uncharacterized membrane protein YfbV (UPF0208 family)